MIAKALFNASQGRLSPRDVDELYIWEIAILLGVGDELTPSEEPPMSKKELLRQRLAYSRGQGPKPEAKAINPTSFNSLANALK